MQAGFSALDHLLIGADSIERGIAWLEKKTGVRAAMGGSHPGLGTWNALASLGPRQYVEIIAPDPGQPGVETFYVPGLRDFPEPRIATWAARGTGLISRFVGSLPAGLSCDTPRQGGRVRPDGTKLAWTLAFPKQREHGSFGGTLPFLIEWGSLDLHPGLASPPGLLLSSISLGHPQPVALREALRGLGIDVAVSRSDSASIRVALETPRGTVLL